MRTTQTSQPLTPELIRKLLKDDIRMRESAEYRRLVEIYCVVKVGGIAKQIEVAQRLEAKEKATLQAEIRALSKQAGTESRVQALEQEMQELERSVDSRLQYLSTIHPEEEAIVQNCLSKIDVYFRELGNKENHRTIERK